MYWKTRAGPGAAIGIVVILIAATSVSRAAQDLYQLEGKVRQENGGAFRVPGPVVYLTSAVEPYYGEALVDLSGHYKIKAVPAGSYILTVSVPPYGRMKMSLDVGPSFADKNWCVVKDVLFRRQELISEASVVQLSIPESARQEYLKARRRLSNQDFDGAFAQLKKVVAVAPRFADALNDLGMISLQAKQFKAAESYFQEALNQDPNSFQSLLNLGGALLSEGKAQEALEFNQRAAKKRPDDPLAQSQLGQNYFRLKQLDLAEHHLKLACSIEPGHYTYPQLVLADIYHHRHDYVSVVRELQRFLSLHPDSKKGSDVQKLLAFAQSRAGQEDRVSTRPQ
jgi:Tfp pilus assembly protein PilF